MAKQEKKKYSYIKKPYARNGWYSLVAALLALLVSVLIFGSAVRANGALSLVFGAFGLCGGAAALLGLWFAQLGLREAGRNKLFAKLGAVLSALLLLLWIVIAAIGIQA